MKRKSIIIFWLTRVNVRMVFLSLIGLVVAISMLASCQYYSSFITKDQYLEIFGEKGVQQFESSSTFPVRDITIHDYRSNISLFENYIAQHELEDILSITPFFPAAYLESNISFGNLMDNRLLSGHMGMDERILTDCVIDSRLPSNNTELLVIAPDNTTLTINENITLGLGYIHEVPIMIDENLTINVVQESIYYLNLTVAGIMTDSSISADSPLRDHLLTDSYHFFMQLASFLDLTTETDQFLASNYSSQARVSIRRDYKIDVNTTAINLNNAKETARKIHAFLEDIDQSTHNIFSHYTNTIEWMINDADIIIILIFILSLPVFILVIALALFSTSIFNTKREKTLIFLRTRGISGRFLFIILLMETLVIALIASAVSVVLGIPLAVIAGLQEGTLSSTNNIPNFMAMLDTGLMVSIIFQGVILTFLISLPAIISLSKASIFALEKVASKKKRRKIRFLSGNLDVILLVLGLAGIFFVYDFVIFSSQTPLLEDIMFLFSPILAILLLTSPFLFLFGAVMFYNRFILIIIHVTGKVLWKRDSWILASAARNLRVNVKLTARTAMIICLCLSFLMFLSIAPLTIIKNDTDSKYYNTGSDISILVESGDEMSNEMIIQEISDILADVPGLDTTKIINCKIKHQYEGIDIVVLGIEPGFESVAHWKSNYDDTPLEELCTVLFNSEMNNTVILDSATAKRENIDINSSYQLFSHDHTFMTVPLEFTDYFPVVESLWYEKGIAVIGKYSYVDNISKQGEFWDRRYVLGKIQPGNDPNEVSNRAKNALKEHGYDFGDDNYLRFSIENRMYYTFVQDELIENSELIYFTIPWVVLTNDFIITLVVILVAITLFNITRLEQNTREIGLNRSIGMKNRQIFGLVFSEPMILLTISGVPGAILGSVTLLGMFQIFGVSQLTGPPLVIYYDLPVIIATYMVLLVFTAFVGMIISFKATKVNISDYLKLE